MDLQTLLDNKRITKYHLSKLSGVPKTTILDICAGRSSIQNCSAKTVQKIAKALDCSMEDIMELSLIDKGYDKEGRPTDKSYFECGLSRDLKNSIEKMMKSWAIEDSGEKDYHWDICWCELNADINEAENSQSISSEQAWYLREKYLRVEREE